MSELTRDVRQRITTPKMLAGITAAAIIGLTSYVALQLFVIFLQVSIGNLFFSKDWTFPSITETKQFFVLYFFYGTPLSLILCFTVGIPLWKLAEGRLLRSYRAAIKLGTISGLLISLLFLSLSLISGVITYFDDSSGSESWQAGYQVESDGLPTLVGWLFHLLNVAEFMIAGAAGGLAARWIALRGKTS